MDGDFMDEIKCSFTYGDDSCVASLNEVKQGTVKKIDLMAHYVEGWLHKILLNKKIPYKGVLFIDCMANAGALAFENRIIEGTAQRVEKIFVKSKTSQLCAKEFEIIVNDIDSRKINCQKCIWKQVVSSNTNVIFNTYNNDVEDFLKNDALRILEDAEKRGYHTLLFYDPYDSTVHWDSLKPFLKSNKVDLIITHFWACDSRRAIEQVTTDEAKRKYEETYGLPFDELLKQFKSKEKLQRNEFLRKLFEDQARKFGASYKKIAYAPVFNVKRQPIYDIVCISFSHHATTLFKNKMYNQYRPEVKDTHQMQTSFFEDLFFSDGEASSYVKNREDGVSEMDFFYNPKNFAEAIQKEFKGLEVTKLDFDNFIELHERIPSSAKKEIKKILKGFFKMEEIKVGRKTVSYKFKGD